MKRPFLIQRSIFSVALVGVWATFSALAVYASAGQIVEAQRWMTKGVKAYDKEDYGAAKHDVDLALYAEPNFAEAYLLKALLQYHDGDIEAAQASLKRASDLNPHLSDELHKHLEDQAHIVEQGLTHQEFSHFTLEFHGATEREKAWDSVKYLDDVYGDLGSRFGVFPSSSIPVIIFNTHEFWEAWNAPSWLGGFFDRTDGKIRVRIDSPPGGDDEMKRRLRHEFTHALIYQLYPHDLPMWFQEGSAQFYAYATPIDAFWKDTRLEELRKLTRGAPWLSMGDVQTAIAKKNVSPGLIYLAYLESESLTLYLAKERGDSWIPSLVTELQKGKSFDDAFKDVVGKSPTDAMAQLQHSWE